MSLSGPSIATDNPESLRRQLARRLTEDHPELDAILEAVADLVSRRSFHSAAKRFGEFRIKQERHMTLEEKVVFPLLETLSYQTVDVARMKSEHRMIRNFMNDAGDAISQWDLRGFAEAHRRLAQAVAVHNEDEERLVATKLEHCHCVGQDLLVNLARF